MIKINRFISSNILYHIYLRQSPYFFGLLQILYFIEFLCNFFLQMVLRISFHFYCKFYCKMHFVLHFTVFAIFSVFAFYYIRNSDAIAFYCNCTCSGIEFYCIFYCIVFTVSHKTVSIPQRFSVLFQCRTFSVCSTHCLTCDFQTDVATLILFPVYFILQV